MGRTGHCLESPLFLFRDTIAVLLFFFANTPSLTGVTSPYSALHTIFHPYINIFFFLIMSRNVIIKAGAVTAAALVVLHLWQRRQLGKANEEEEVEVDLHGRPWRQKPRGQKAEYWAEQGGGQTAGEADEAAAVL